MKASCLAVLLGTLLLLPMPASAETLLDQIAGKTCLGGYEPETSATRSYGAIEFRFSNQNPVTVHVRTAGGLRAYHSPASANFTVDRGSATVTVVDGKVVFAMPDGVRMELGFEEHNILKGSNSLKAVIKTECR